MCEGLIVVFKTSYEVKYIGQAPSNHVLTKLYANRCCSLLENMSIKLFCTQCSLPRRRTEAHSNASECNCETFHSIKWLFYCCQTGESLPVSFGRNLKSQQSARTLFALAHRHGDILREGWKNIMDCMLQLFKAKMLPKSMVEVLKPFAFDVIGCTFCFYYCVESSVSNS